MHKYYTGSTASPATSSPSAPRASAYRGAGAEVKSQQRHVAGPGHPPRRATRSPSRSSPARRGVSTDDQVRFLGPPHAGSASPSPARPHLHGGGEPRDGRARDRARTSIDDRRARRSTRPSASSRASMVRTGIPMIDVFNSLVESQKLPDLLASPASRTTRCSARIALQAEVDMIILGGMGLQVRRLPFFRDTSRRAARWRAPSSSSTPPPTPWSSACWCRTSPGGGRAVRAAGQARAGAADRHDQLRRRPQGDRHHHGADPLEPRLSRRPLQPARRALREGGGLRGRPARSPSWRSPPCPATTSPTRCRTTPATSPRGSSTCNGRPDRAVRLALAASSSWSTARPATTTARSWTP